MTTINKTILPAVICLLIAGCNLANSNNSNSASPYQLVIDAGSSGSRIYVYHKLATDSGMVIHDIYESKVSTQLASFADNPQNAGTKGIQPLLMNAINFLENNESMVNLSTVPTSVLGTAGMRLTSESSQMAIYHSVAQTILANGLKLDQTKTITGQYKGLYSWADVNYLQNNFNNNKTKGIFEVGGASAQLAFVTSQVADKHIVPVRVNNKSYNVYSISFLGLGQDVAIKSMNQMPDHNACYPVGYSNISLGINGNFNYNYCNANYNSIIALYPEINQVKNVLNYTSQPFIGISGVYYALRFWNIESQPSLLTQNINKTCINSYNQIVADHPSAYKPENQCANSVLINTIMFDNLAMKPNQLTAVSAINGTALTWTLGYVLISNTSN